MNAQDVLQALAAEGGTLSQEGDGLAYEGPPDAFERHRAEIIRLKPDLLALLASPEGCWCEVIGRHRWPCPPCQAVRQCLMEPIIEEPTPAYREAIAKALRIFGGPDPEKGDPS